MHFTRLRRAGRVGHRADLNVICSPRHRRAQWAEVNLNPTAKISETLEHSILVNLPHDFQDFLNSLVRSATI